MNLIKNLIKYLLTTVVIFSAGLFLIQKTDVIDQKYYQRIFPCSKPFEYSIGIVDPKFGISAQDFIGMAGEAESIWERSTGKNLFQYNPDAQFKLNLIYDERQQQSDDAQRIEEDLEQLNSSHDAIMKEYNNLSSAYKQRVNAYNASVADYERELKEYNKDVAYWNSQGGAPEDEYDKLKKRKKELSVTFEKLEKERVAVNQLVGKTNSLVQKENRIVDTYNDNLATYKNRFGGSREFEKGVFDGTEISIYQFNEDSDLRLTLIHELGHALGIGHVEDPESIMYYLMSEQNMDSPQLSPEDIRALKDVCGIN